SSPAHPCRALVGNCDGAKRARSTNRHTVRLIRLDAEKTLTSMPNDARKIASAVPTRSPDARASPTRPTPRPRNHTYGTVIANAASQRESAAKSLPTVSCKRGTGVRRRLSSVPRSRSPLTASAAASRLRRAPTAMATWSVRFTDSRCSRKFSAWLVATRYDSTLKRRLKQRHSHRPRPPSQRSRSSWWVTTAQPRRDARRAGVGVASAVISGGLRHGKECIAQSRPFELVREERDPRVQKCLQTLAHQLLA